MRALSAGRELGLASWCIGAGTIRNLVWDHLHGFEKPTPSLDLDLVFYDAENLDPCREWSLEMTLSARVPGVQWEAVNQATVHHWLQAQATNQVTDHMVPPFHSLAAGIASWPEVATCVGVTLTAAGEIEVIAPHGLSDLFDMIVRFNPACVSRAAYLYRISSKRWAERWPRVAVMQSDLHS